MSKINKKNIKTEKGSTTSMVIFTIFFLIVALMGSFIMNSVIRKSQLEQTDEIRKTYELDADKIYSEKTGSSNKVYIANAPGSNVLSLPSTIKAGESIIFNNTGTRNTGSIIRFTVPTQMNIQLEGWGAAGSNGNTYTAITQPGGKGAYIKSEEISVDAGTELLILVGQKGDINPAAYAGDGVAGGGGGGTFICKVVSSSSYLFTGVSPNVYVEPLLIAAGRRPVVAIKDIALEEEQEQMQVQAMEQQILDLYQELSVVVH